MLVMFGWQQALSDEDGQWLCEGTASSTTYHDGTFVPQSQLPPSFVLQHTEDHVFIKYPSFTKKFDKEPFHNSAFFAATRIKKGDFISFWKVCGLFSDCRNAETMRFIRSLHMEVPGEKRDPRASTISGFCRKLVG